MVVIWISSKKQHSRDCVDDTVATVATVSNDTVATVATVLTTQLRQSQLCSPQNLKSLKNTENMIRNGYEPSWVITIMYENNTDVYMVIRPSNGGDLDFVEKVNTVATVA